jgi:hypothetical protein
MRLLHLLQLFRTLIMGYTTPRFVMNMDTAVCTQHFEEEERLDDDPPHHVPTCSIRIDAAVAAQRVVYRHRDSSKIRNNLI